MDQGLNWTLAEAVNGLAGHIPLLDRVVASIATDLIFVIFLAAIVWWFIPSAGKAGKYAALAAVLAVVVGQTVNFSIGHLLFVPRPFVAHNVHLLVKAAQDSSFPSDHTTAAFAVAVTALLRRMPGRRLLLVAAILVAFSRVYVGAHYPADVVVSAALGTVWAFAILKLESWLAYPYKIAIDIAQRIHLA